MPTNFLARDALLCVEEDCDAYVVSVTNVGVKSSSGPVIVRDELPGGVVLQRVTEPHEREPGGSSHEVRCAHAAAQVTCTYTGAVPPEGVIDIAVEVTVSSESSGVVTNQVEVEGGGAPRAVSSPPGTVANALNGTPPGFGIQSFGAQALGSEGANDVQAAGHPATDTISLDFNTLLDELTPKRGGYYAVQEPKTEIFDLPAGLIADPLALEQCPLYAVNGTENEPEECPAGSQVGWVAVESHSGKGEVLRLYNVPPESGYPAELAFDYAGATVTLLARLLPSLAGYTMSLAVPYLAKTEAVTETGTRVTLFGDPSERDGTGGGEAFLTNPDACGSPPLQATLEADSWVNPGDWVSAQTPMFEANSSQGVSGCGLLSFYPSIQVTPETSATDTPSGYRVDVRTPQAPNAPGVLATPDLKDAVVSLPEGVTISPGAGNGLVGCAETGAEGIELGDHDKLSDGNQVQAGEQLGPDGLVHPAPGHCPAASQIGEAEILTPILPEPLKGHIYLAAPRCGGEGQPHCAATSAEDGELLGLYVEVASERYGVYVKLQAAVSANPQTGRLTVRIDEAPQLPIDELELKLDGGPRALLANPQSCGAATTTSDLTPWSTPDTPDANPSSSFTVAGCTGGPFAPGFIAGTVDPAAGSYSPLTLTLSRRDGEADLGGLSVTLPPGLLATIAGVQLCGEAQAGAGTCPAASRIGTATVAAGSGADPYWQSGAIYLTGPYDGAPFGLAVVVGADIGPFDLGQIVVRAAIAIDPGTARMTIDTAAGGSSIPAMLDGVPLRIKTVNLSIDRPGFIFDPTSCNATSITATIGSTAGANAAAAEPFQVTGCGSLPFRPKLTVSTSGKTSIANGASLKFKLTFPPATGARVGSATGGEVNLAKLKIDLPKRLPSRLTTLQKGCRVAVFDADPAGCPAESETGYAVVYTPLLGVPLSGPAIFVSHGDEAFPSLTIVLQGDGVRIDLVGDTSVRSGVSSTTFQALPDVPIGTLEVTLPEGPYSALAANGNLCSLRKTVTVRKKVTVEVHAHKKTVARNVKETVASSLVMPSELVAQNGAEIKQGTQISVTGCAKAKPAKKAKTKQK